MTENANLLSPFLKIEVGSLAQRAHQDYNSLIY